MVRTLDNGRPARVTGGKAARKGGSTSTAAVLSTNKGGSSSSWGGGGGGNPVCPRETPNWQRPISAFFSSAGNGSTSKTLQSCVPAVSTSGQSNSSGSQEHEQATVQQINKKIKIVSEGQNNIEATDNREHTLRSKTTNSSDSDEG